MTSLEERVRTVLEKLPCNFFVFGFYFVPSSDRCNDARIAENVATLNNRSNGADESNSYENKISAVCLECPVLLGALKYYGIKTEDIPESMKS